MIEFTTLQEFIAVIIGITFVGIFCYGIYLLITWEDS